jgi:hypothetical protein
MTGSLARPLARTTAIGLFICFAIASFALVAAGQVETQQVDSATSAVVVNPPPPKTHLQAAAEQKGALIIGGYTDVGTVQREDGGSIRITAAEFTNTATSTREYGLLVFIHQQADGVARDTRSFIDADEVDSLLSALDGMSKLDRTTTTLNDFDARFRTRGDLEIANVNVNGVREVNFHGVEIISSSGQEIWASTHFPLARLSEVTQYLTAGKQLIEKDKESK